MTVTEQPVVLRTRLGGQNLRSDRWWLPPLVTVVILAGFIGYGTWVAFANTDYYAMFGYLGNAGLDPARDVTFTLRPGPIAQVVDPLNEGKFDGFYAGPPGILPRSRQAARSQPAHR